MLLYALKCIFILINAKETHDHCLIRFLAFAESREGASRPSVTLERQDKPHISGVMSGEFW